MRSVHQDASFKLSKTVFGKNFKFFIIKGVGGSKIYPTWNKRLKKFVGKKFLTKGQNGTRKWVVEGLVIICGAFMVWMGEEEDPRPVGVKVAGVATPPQGQYSLSHLFH